MEEFLLLVITSTLCSVPVPVKAKQSHRMMLPLPCLVADTNVFRFEGLTFTPPNVALDSCFDTAPWKQYTATPLQSSFDQRSTHSQFTYYHSLIKLIVSLKKISTYLTYSSVLCTFLTANSTLYEGSGLYLRQCYLYSTFHNM